MKNLTDTFNKLPNAAKLIIVVIIIILLFLAARQVKRVWNRPAKVKVDPSNIPALGNDSQGNQVLWDPDPLAREIHDNLEGYNFYTYRETSDKILSLQTDDQVKLLYNHYNKNYAKDYPTLTQLFENEWEYAWDDANYSAVVNRLKALNLH